MAPALTLHVSGTFGNIALSIAVRCIRAYLVLRASPEEIAVAHPWGLLHVLGVRDGMAHGSQKFDGSTHFHGCSEEIERRQTKQALLAW